MNSGNYKLIDIAQKHLEQICRRARWSIRFLLDFPKFEKYVHELLKGQTILLETIERDINMNTFRKFIREPQINDLLIDYLLLIVKVNVMGTAPKKKIFKDDVENYLVGVIENYFEDLSTENTIIAIRTYVNTLTKICSSELDDSMYSEIVERKDRQIISKLPLSDVLSEKRFFVKDIEKIEMEMKQAFILRKAKYDDVKRNYSKSLRQYYQNGFIYLLGEYKFNEFYIPPILVKGPREQDIYFRHSLRIERDNINKIRERWKNIFCINNIIYVVGGAGYGKTLFLRNIINNYLQLKIENIQDYLLIYCDLKAYFNGIISKKTMIDFFQESMISTAGIEDISKEFISYYLKVGRCIVLLDALDEVPKTGRDDLHKSIMAFFAACNPNNKVCITSRDRGFLPQQNIDVLEIIPLSEKDIDDYIEKMIELKKFKKEDKETFMMQAQVLIKKGFLNNFLVLSLLVNIYKSEKELPENKIDLYKKCFEYIAKKREEEKSKTGYDWNNIYPLMKDSTFIRLSTLAAPNNIEINREDVERLLLKMYKTKYSDEAKAECAIREFLDFCSNRTELFVPASVDDKFKFFHRSFFEYFYSRYIHQQSDIKVMYDLMAKFDVDSEVFELTVALVKEDNEEKYQKLIEYILEKVEHEFNQLELSGTAFGILTLAMQVIDDAYYIRKYYEIIIKYDTIISRDGIGNMNQRLMSMWVDKEIAGNNEKIDEFLKIFSVYCVRYLLVVMSRIKVSGFCEIHSNRWNIIHEDDELDRTFIEMSGRVGNLPFYLLLINKYGNLYEILEEYVNKGFQSIDAANIKRSVLKKGFYNYKKLSHEERKQYLKFLQERK